MLNNQQAHNKLSKIVIDKFLNDAFRYRIEVGPLQINCFSICFWINLAGGKSKKGVYVKIPKIILYDLEKEKIMPLSDDDRELAEDEYQSLLYLSKNWKSDDINVRFVKPLGFIKEFNAIITERFYAEHFFKVYRKHDIKRKFLNSKKADPTPEVMFRLGNALSRFHNKSGKDTIFDTEETNHKMEKYLLELKNSGVDSGYLNSIAKKFERYTGFTAPTKITKNLKGFDIRQVFINKSNCLYLLDPGKIKEGYKEVDLARFIVTCRILYWGSLAIFFRLTPNLTYEESFLNGYCQSNKISEKILRILIIKELFKHWRMASFALDKKTWPGVCKQFLKKAYMDTFYKWQIDLEISKMGN